MPGPRSLAILVLSAVLLGAPAVAAANTAGHHTKRTHRHAAAARHRVHPTTHGAPAQHDGGTAYAGSPPPATGTGNASAAPAATGGALAGDASVSAGPTGPSGPAGLNGPTGATDGTGGASGPAGPAGPTVPPGLTVPTGAPSVPGAVARILPDGLAAAPAGAPAAVVAVIAAGNQLIGEPYVYGGGHASFISNGYDCSGAVSYALHGANLLPAPLDSSALELWGMGGAGEWITVYANPQHTYVDIAGIRLDTSSAGDAGGQTGPRWRPLLSSHAGYVVRHPSGL